jgi:integrase
MWLSLTKWAVTQTPPVALTQLTCADLERFLERRACEGTGGAELSPRYVWRLLNLVDRVLCHDARRCARVDNNAARELLESRPEWQYANAADKNPLPDCLAAPQARALVRHLGASLPRRTPATAPPAWQDLRNRAMVAVMLGAGVTPGEARDLRINSVIDMPVRGRLLPWKLQIAAHERTHRRETPLSAWAGQVLRHWMDTRAAMKLPGEHLFPSTRTGKPIQKVAQYEAVRQVLEAAGLPPALVSGGSFRLRHTFALRQLRRGHDPAEVARWLGIDAAELARYARVVYAPLRDTDEGR